MRSAAGPKPVREPPEIRLVDGVQHLDGRPLNDLVLQRSNAERPQPPVRLGDVHPARRLRPVGAPLNPCVKVPEVALQVLPVGLPCLAIDPGGRPRAQRPIRGTEPINIDMVQQCREPCGPVLRGDVPHTLQRT